MVKDRGGRFRDTEGHFALLLDDRPPKEREAHQRNRDSDEQNRSGYHEECFVSQREAADFLGPCGADLPLSCRAESIRKMLRNQTENQRRDKNRDKLVDQIDQQVRTELRQKQRELSGLIKRPGDRCGDPFSDPTAVQKPGQNTAEAPADQRKGKSRRKKPGNTAKCASPRQISGTDRNQNIDGTVVGGREVREAVENIGQKPDGNAGHVSAQRRGQHGPDGIQKQGQAEKQSQSGADYIDQDAARDQEEKREKSFFQICDRIAVRIHLTSPFLRNQPVWRYYCTSKKRMQALVRQTGAAFYHERSKMTNPLSRRAENGKIAEI